MKDFRSKVQKAIGSMGEAPYNDKQTMACALEVSRRTSEHCDKLKESKKKRSAAVREEKGL